MEQSEERVSETSTTAISVEVDFEAEVGKVEYRVGSMARIETVSPGVFAEFDSQSQVLGIELMALDYATLVEARDFAEAHDLEFPEFLRSCMLASAALIS